MDSLQSTTTTNTDNTQTLKEQVGSLQEKVDSLQDVVDKSHANLELQKTLQGELQQTVSQFTSLFQRAFSNDANRELEGPVILPITN